MKYNYNYNSIIIYTLYTYNIIYTVERPQRKGLKGEATSSSGVQTGGAKHFFFVIWVIRFVG